MSVSTQKYYEKHAARWAELKTNSFYHEDSFRVFEKLLKKGDCVIDIGCAHGIHAPLFLGIGNKLKYEGIDASKSMVRIARSRYPQISFSVKNALTFKSVKKFDAFWSVATLMHVPIKDWNKMLNNIERNIKKGGLGYITLPESRPNPATEKDNRHFEFFKKGDFENITKNRGWKILKTGELPLTKSTTMWRWYIVRLP